MAADKRSVSTDALETLGTIIDDKQKRDAIHLAVLPMVAAVSLHVGEHVDKDGNPVKAYSRTAVGIVDPFIDATRVNQGEHFWLVIYPRVITSLRHVWSHPALPDEPMSSSVSASVDARSIAEAWMRRWAMEHMSTDYYGEEGANVGEDVAYASSIQAGHDHHIGPYEDARDHIDSEWWSNWEVITGTPGARGEYFSCSC